MGFAVRAFLFLSRTFHCKLFPSRIKKKIESDINELEMALDHANKANAEQAKHIKRLAASLLEVDTAVEEEARARAELEDQAGIVDRKGESFFLGSRGEWVPNHFDGGV